MTLSIRRAAPSRNPNCCFTCRMFTTVTVETGSSTAVLAGLPSVLGDLEQHVGGLHPHRLEVGQHREGPEAGPRR
jgi:hypothetical protein